MVIQLVVLLSGFVLWAPVLTELPGVKPLSSVGRGAYLIVQSIVPSFLSVVWIFARRPLYASYDHHQTVVGMSPVLDQQLAGFLAKLCTIAVLWTVAFSLMMRSHAAAGVGEDPEPLLWSDVETGDPDGPTVAPCGPGAPRQVRPRTGYRPNITCRPTTRPRDPRPDPRRDSDGARSGQRSAPQLVERQLRGLIAAALRALLDVAPRPQQARCPPGSTAPRTTPRWDRSPARSKARHAVVAAWASSASPLRTRRKRSLSVSKIHVL